MNHQKNCHLIHITASSTDLITIISIISIISITRSAVRNCWQYCICIKLMANYIKDEIKYPILKRVCLMAMPVSIVSQFFFCSVKTPQNLLGYYAVYLITIKRNAFRFDNLVSILFYTRKSCYTVVISSNTVMKCYCVSFLYYYGKQIGFSLLRQFPSKFQANSIFQDF